MATVTEVWLAKHKLRALILPSVLKPTADKSAVNRQNDNQQNIAFITMPESDNDSTCTQKKTQTGLCTIPPLSRTSFASVMNSE